jgi:RNA polymerase sigma factor (sigma-70 family)
MTKVGLLTNDRELLAAFRAGRREALECVYRAYVRAVDRALRTLARGSGHPEMAKSNAIADLLQEVFVRAFSPSARRAYDGLRDFEPYLMTIARNCFFDVLRASGRELPKHPEELALLIDADMLEPESWCDPKVLAVLTGYLRDLAPALVGVYQQRFELGRSQAETSATLGLSRGEIRTYEKQLRRGLRKALVQAGISLNELHQRDKNSSTEIPAPTVVQKG